MLLDDSIELECNDSSIKAEPLPVNWDIDLSKIWIPSSILPNRKKQINPNENKPFILYSLEKPDYSKTVSVYSDECPQYHESQTPPILPRISHNKLINGYINKHEVQQTLPSSQNAIAWNARLDIDGENVISPKHQINNKKVGDSLRDCQKTSDPMIRNVTQWEKKASNPSIHEAIYRASLEDLTRRMAEILSEDEPLKENWYHEDVIKTSEVTSSALNSILPNTKDSLEELYYSDEDGNQFAVEYELNSLEFESPEKKPTDSIYTENFNVQEQISESFVNSLEKSMNGSDKTAFQSFEETEKIQFENQKVSNDMTFGQGEHGELSGIECEVHTKDYEQELHHRAGELEDPTEKVLEFPVAYKRPPLHEQTIKAKTQKGKKKTKKIKKNINLEDFFESEEVDRFKIPEFDEFYENLVHQGKCKPLNQEIDNGLPSVNFKQELQTIVNEFPLSQSDQSQSSFWNSAQKFRESLSSESQSNSPKEIIRNEEREPKLESRASLETLVIDNIPLNVSQENIENFIVGYGELKNLTIERYEKFQRAKLQMDFMCEIDWIIDCLNGSQPFGSFGKELIKCYRQA